MRHKSRPKTGPRKFWRTLFSQYVLQQTDAEVPNNLLGTAAKETARKSVHRGSAGIRSGETARKVFFCYVARFRSNILSPTAPMRACCLGPRRNPARWLRISSWCLHAGQPIERIRAGITPCSLPLRSQFCRPVVPGLLRKLIFLTYVAHATRANRSSVGSGARMSSLQR